MISSHDRSGWFGASDTDYIVGNWNTATFAKWWLTKIGINRSDFQNQYLLAGTHKEHKILNSLQIPLLELDKQILIPELKLRVNLDGNTSDCIYECKTYTANKPFKVPLKYKRQVWVQMYAAKLKTAKIVAYGLTKADYNNFFLPIDKKRLSIIDIPYNEAFIYEEYLPKLEYLASCLEKGIFPDENDFLNKKKGYKMKVLSLFDGISCGMVALERAGIPVERYCAYEIEPNAIKISKKNYPNIIHCGDVTKADFTQYQGIDLLMGGSPCQSLSIVQSKTRQHLDGKSKLFFEFVRALEETRPKWFLFENVASMNEESKRAISECLGCDPIFIDSNCFSAQDRPRYYWTNIPVKTDGLKECNLCLRDILQDEVDPKYFYDYPLSDIDLTKQVCAIMDFKNHDIHKRVFNPNFKVHTLTTCGGGNTQKKVLLLEKVNGGYMLRARKLTPLEYERSQTLPDNYTAGVADGHRYTACGNGWTVDVIAYILSFIPNL